MTDDTNTQGEMRQSLYEEIGEERGVRELVESFHRLVSTDELLSPLFANEKPTHVEHLTAWFTEVLGGPSRYTDEMGGFSTLLEAHRGLRIDKDHAEAFKQLFMTAVDQCGIGAGSHLHDRLHAYIDFGVEVAVQNSHAESDADLHGCNVVPRWH